MEIWFVAAETLVNMGRVSSTFELLPENIFNNKGQSILKNAHENRLWLACNCKQPHPIMFPRCREGRYHLVNHAEKGFHAEGCAFSTLHGGKEKKQGPLLGDSSSNELKKNKFILFRNFATNEEPENKPQNASSTPSKKAIDPLLSILHHLIDDSFLHVYHAGSYAKPEQMLGRLRGAAKRYHLQGVGNFSRYVFTGLKGMEYAELQLNNYLRSENHSYRPQSLVIVAAKTIEYSNEVITIVDERGQILVLPNVEKRGKVAGGMKLLHTPAYVALAMSFPDAQSKQAQCLKWSVQPVDFLLSPLPVNSLRERIITIELKRLLNEHAKQYPGWRYWLTKPVLPSVCHRYGGLLHPDFLLTKESAKGKRTVALDLLLEDDEEYLKLKTAGRLPLISKFGDYVEVKAWHTSINDLEAAVATAFSRAASFLDE